MKTLQNNFTTPEQSKRLLEIGVHANSADCYYNKYRILPELLFNGDTMQDLLDANKPQNPDEYLPCWSAGRLMEIIDICDSSNYKDEWPRVEEVTQGFGSVVEYLVRTIEWCVNNNKIDFSKLED